VKRPPEDIWIECERGRFDRFRSIEVTTDIFGEAQAVFEVGDDRAWRTLIMAIRKLKDSQGGYLWQPGLGGYVAQGTALIQAIPETIIGTPFNVSELMPNTQTTGLYVGIIGDFSKYWIADALDMQIQRLVELYAGSNQTGFLFRKETDGMPVLEEAFVRMKQA
jgi:HK97 family phage major capsid protein